LKKVLCDVGGFGDVLDRCLGKTLLRKEMEGGPEEAFRDVGAAALAAGGGKRSEEPSGMDETVMMARSHL